MKILALGTLAALVHALPISAQAGDPLTLVRSIALPDVRGRIDHLAVDLAGGRLFVAAVGNDTIEVIDIRTGRWSSRIQGMRDPHGVVFVPEKQRLFVANGGGTVDTFDGDLRPTGRIESLADADNVRYDAATGRIFVGYAGALAMINASTMQKSSADIKLAGPPEGFQVDRGRSRIYVNVPSARHIAVVDLQKGSVSDKWGLGDLRENYPMALDEPTGRLFVATRQPATLLVYDVTNGTRIAGVSACGDADDVFSDGDTGNIYVICGEGVIDVFRRSNVDQYVKVGQVPTARGARTGLFVSSSRTVFVAVPAQWSKPAEIREYRVQ